MLAPVIERVQVKVEQLLNDGEYQRAIKMASALHTAGITADTLKILIATAEATSRGIWNPDEPLSAANVWTQITDLFPRDETLPKLAARFTNDQAVALSRADNFSAAVVLFRHAVRCDNAARYRKNLVSAMRRLASRALDAGNTDRAMKICRSALAVDATNTKVKELLKRVRKARDQA